MKRFNSLNQKLLSMKSLSFRFPIRSLCLVGLVLLGASAALAQGGGGAGRGGGGGGIVVGGGGGGGISGGAAGSGNSTRTYINSTMVGDATITSDMDTRRVIVVTDDATNENIKTVIAGLDRPKPQVLINVVFLQVEHDNDLNLGAEASYTGPVSLNSSKATGTGSTNFGIASTAAANAGSGAAVGALYTLANNKVNATINALASTNKTQILSRPSILTRSGQQATVMVGQSIPIITNSQVSSVTNAITNTVTYQDIGIILAVTPFITAEGNVEMIVSPQTSALSATTVQTSAGVNSPVIDKTQADTVVVTPSDRTVVIGGLISSNVIATENKFPLLGDIPLLGYAFKHKVNSTKKSELLIFLTPHVVNSPEDLSHLAEGERAKLDLVPKSIDKDDMQKYIGGR